MKKNVFIYVGLFLFLFAATVNAKIFSDDFDNQNYTNGNWTGNPALWRFADLGGSDYGYQGFYDVVNYEDSIAYVSSPAISFELTGLSVRAELSVHQAQITEPTHSEFKDEGGGIFFADLTNGLGAQASLSYSYPFDGWIHSAGKTGEDAQENLIANINFDQFYIMEFSIDQSGNLTSHLRQSDGSIISTINQHIDYSLTSGVVGIYSEADATFNNFTASQVPVPATVLLFASGLAGVFALKRRNHSV